MVFFLRVFLLVEKHITSLARLYKLRSVPNMKKLIAVATISLGLLGLTACGGSSENVAETKAGNVTKDELYDEMVATNGEEALKKLVTLKVLEDKYEVSDKEVDAELEKIKDEVGEEFEQVLTMQGVTEEELKTDIKSSMLQEEAITEGIEISEDEMKQYYDRMTTEVEARHILVQDEDTAKDIKKKLDDGGDFAKLAKEHSVDEGTAEQGGEVGFFSVGSMVPEFEDAAFTMKKGELSDPIQSEFGFHIIEVLDTKETDEDVGSFEDNEEEIRRTLAERKVNPEDAMEKINKLLEDADINIKIEGLEDIFKEEAPALG